MILKRLLCLMLLLALLAACGGNTVESTPKPTATAVPGVKAATTEAPPTEPPPAAAPALPTNTAEPQATEPPTELPATAPTDTAPTPTNTVAARPTQPRPTATSSGPLEAVVYVANCRSAPTAEKPGRVIVQISVEATGGNGKYRYTFQNKDYPTKFIDLVGEKGTRIIETVFVTSGDQQLKKEFDVGIDQLNCP